MSNISGIKLFLLLTYRPEYAPSWDLKSYHGQVNLNRLSNRESLLIVSHILGTIGFDQKLKDLILEKSEGIPFFVEEFIKSLKQLEIIEKRKRTYQLTKKIKSLNIPSTIEEVIMARVDALPERAKEILQAGSVIEREFSYELIKFVADIQKEELLSHFTILKDAELIYEKGVYPENTYIFKHALTREVVYNSLLSNKKKTLHEKTGNAIEILFTEKLYEYYGVLVEHFIKGNNYEKGAGYAKLANRKAHNEAAFVDAISYAKQLVFCIENMPQTAESQKKLIDARTLLGINYSSMNYHVEAKKTVEPVVDLAIKFEYKKRLSQIYTILGTYNCHANDDFIKAFDYLEEAVKLSEATENYFSLVNSLFWLGFARSYNCEYEKALSNFERGLSLNQSVNALTWVSIFKSSICVTIYCPLGKVNLGLETSNEAVQIAEECNDIFSKGMAYTSLGYAFYYKGFFPEAVNNFLKAITFHEKTKFYSWNAVAHFILGEIYCEDGNFIKAQEYLKKAILLSKQSGLSQSWVNNMKLSLTLVSVKNNEGEIDLNHLFSYVSKNKWKIFDGWMRAFVSEILLNTNDPIANKAENWIKEALEVHAKNGMKWHLGKDYVLYAEFYKQRDKKTNARENFNRAINIYKKCGANGWVEKIQYKLASLS